MPETTPSLGQRVTADEALYRRLQVVLRDPAAPNVFNVEWWCKRIMQFVHAETAALQDDLDVQRRRHLAYFGILTVFDAFTGQDRDEAMAIADKTVKAVVQRAVEVAGLEDAEAKRKAAIWDEVAPMLLSQFTLRPKGYGPLPYCLEEFCEKHKADLVAR